MYICLIGEGAERILEVSKVLYDKEEILVSFSGAGVLRIDREDGNAKYDRHEDVDVIEIGSDKFNTFGDGLEDFIIKLKSVLMEAK